MQETIRPEGAAFTWIDRNNEMIEQIYLLMRAMYDAVGPGILLVLLIPIAGLVATVIAVDRLKRSRAAR